MSQQENPYQAPTDLDQRQNNRSISWKSFWILNIGIFLALATVILISFAWDAFEHIQRTNQLGNRYVSYDHQYEVRPFAGLVVLAVVFGIPNLLFFAMQMLKRSSPRTSSGTEMEKPIAEIRKRPSVTSILAVTLLIGMLALISIACLQFFVSSLRLNGILVMISLMGLIALPIILAASEFVIFVVPSGENFEATRQLIVFGRVLAERSFSELADIYWKKSEYGESGKIHYHVYGRSYWEPENFSTATDVMITGGFWHLISLKKKEVESLRTAFQNSRSAV